MRNYHTNSHLYTGIQLEGILDKSNKDNWDRRIQHTSLSILQFPCHNSINIQNNHCPQPGHAQFYFLLEILIG